MSRLDWLPFFQKPDEEDAVRAEEEEEAAREWLSMVDSKAFGLHMAWIEREINRPFSIGQQAEMVQAAVRSNTFKEIRAAIQKETERAKSLLNSERE